MTVPTAGPGGVRNGGPTWASPFWTPGPSRQPMATPVRISTVHFVTIRAQDAPRLGTATVRFVTIGAYDPAHVGMSAVQSITILAHEGPQWGSDMGVPILDPRGRSQGAGAGGQEPGGSSQGAGARAVSPAVSEKLGRGHCSTFPISQK